MNPALIAAIIKYIQLAIAAAPEIQKAVEWAKNFIGDLFSAKVISIEQQNALFSHVDALGTVFKAGQALPSHWTVEPNPTTTTTVVTSTTP